MESIRKNRTVALVYRLLSLAIILFGILLSLGIFEGMIQYRLFIYYTFQSNIWCFLFFLFLIYETANDIKTKGKTGYSTVSPLIRGEVMLSIILTHLVFHFILRPRKFKMNSNNRNPTVYFIQNVFVHYVTPYLTVFDYLFFCEKNSFGLLHPFAWLLLPFAYIIDVFVVAHFITEIPSKKSRYPYFFFDIDLYGIEKVVKYNIGLGIGLIIFAYLIVLFDRSIHFFQRCSHQETKHLVKEKEN